MADKIRERLERFIPDLLVLQRRKVFTQEQVKEILRQREEYEYILERRTHDLKDYMKVLDYEYRLERQRRQKVKELHIKKVNSRDFAIIKRIIQLWDRIMNRYRYNPELWKQYLSFCYKIESKKQFFKVVTNALRFNTHNEDLWVLGALYEFEVARNPFKARKIFYQGLKSNSKSSKIWKEYLDFELCFLEQIQQRTEQQLDEIKDFIPFEPQEEQKFIIKKEPNIEGIKTVINLAIENCNNITIYYYLMEVLEQHNQLNLHADLKQRLLKQLQNDNSISEYCELIVNNVEQLTQYLKQHGNVLNMVRGLLIRLKIATFDYSSIIYNHITKHHQTKQLLKELLQLEQPQFKQLLTTELLKNEKDPIQLIISMNKLNQQCNEEQLDQSVKYVNKLKTKQELLDFFIILLDQHYPRQKIFQLAKTHLLTQQQLFEQFLEKYFLKEDLQQMEWLLKQQQYCPLRYHLINKSLSYAQLIKLGQYFPKQWNILYQRIHQDYPEKDQETMLHIPENLREQVLYQQ